MLGYKSDGTSHILGCKFVPLSYSKLRRTASGKLIMLLKSLKSFPIVLLCLLVNISQLSTFLKLLHEFKSISGLEINTSETEAMWLGAW